ncbi:hypothetical protein MHTCC0001_35660 [Flavobacteriaceae bacterium MHTCC 0001]
METTTKKNNNKIEAQHIKLVDGCFKPSEAAEIIDSILDIKINYHKIKRLSITEGNCNDLCVYDNGRINELIDAKLDAKNFLNDAKLKGKKLKIYGTLSIEIDA